MTNDGKNTKRGHFYKLFTKNRLFCNYFRGGGGVFFFCKAPPTQAPPLCTWHVTQGGSAPDAGAFGSAQGSDTTGGAPTAGATASAGQPGACPPSLFFSHPPCFCCFISFESFSLRSFFFIQRNSLASHPFQFPFPFYSSFLFFSIFLFFSVFP